MKTSEQVNEIATALAKAQGEMKNPEKTRTAKYPTKTGGIIEYNYADLPACLDAIREPFAKHGLSHSVRTGFAGGEGAHYTLFCRLSHSSGQWYESEWPLPGTAEPKAIGAAITYGTRYLLCGLAGMSGDEDMDEEPQAGGRYVDRGPPGGVRSAAMADKPKHPSEAQIKRLWTIAHSFKIPDELVKQYCLTRFKINSSKELSLPQYDELCNAIERGTILPEPGAGG